MNIYDLTSEKLNNFLSVNGYSAYHGEAIMKSLYRDMVCSADELNVKKEVKELISDNFAFPIIECTDVSESETASKYLFRLNDGNLVEAVLMKHKYGNSICVSTQSGCNMGCAFCRSGRLKKIRNLSAGEIVQQVLSIMRISGSKMNGISIMGIGEPFDNYENVMDFVDIALYQNGLDFGPKHITVSTCGIVPKIEKLAKSKYNINLAISLHAPNNALRSELMPINKSYPLEKLIPAVKSFSVATNRRVTLEYVMLKGINDSTENAQELADLIKGSKCYVNIIRYNPSDGDKFECSDFEQIMKFYDVLKKNKVGVTMRREMGAGVNAACGQLRSDYLSKH